MLHYNYADVQLLVQFFQVKDRPQDSPAGRDLASGDVPMSLSTESLDKPPSAFEYPPSPALGVKSDCAAKNSSQQNGGIVVAAVLTNSPNRHPRTKPAATTAGQPTQSTGTNGKPSVGSVASTQLPSSLGDGRKVENLASLLSRMKEQPDGGGKAAEALRNLLQEQQSSRVAVAAKNQAKRPKKTDAVTAGGVNSHTTNAFDNVRRTLREMVTGQKVSTCQSVGRQPASDASTTAPVAPMPEIPRSPKFTHQMVRNSFPDVHYHIHVNS